MLEISNVYFTEGSATDSAKAANKCYKYLIYLCFGSPNHCVIQRICGKNIFQKFH